MSNRGVRRRVARDEEKARQAHDAINRAAAPQYPAGVVAVECHKCGCSFGVGRQTLQKFRDLGKPFECYQCCGQPFRIIGGEVDAT